MSFGTRMKNPRMWTSVAMLFLVAGIAWPNLFHATSQTGLNVEHAVRGFLFGISFGINLMALWQMRRQRHCPTNESAPH